MARSSVSVYKSAGVDAAIVAGDMPAMNVAALRTLSAIQAQSQRIRDTGGFARSWRIATVRGERGSGRRVNDRVVYSDDKGALAIEYGHFAGKTRKVEGSRRVQTGKLTWVPGQHPIQKAIDGMRAI